MCFCLIHIVRTYKVSTKQRRQVVSFALFVHKKPQGRLKVSSVLACGRCDCVCFRIHEEAGEGGVPPLVAVNGVALVLLTVQPHTFTLAERQQQALTLHLPSLRCVLVEHHGLHLTLAGHQLHRNSLTGVFPHSESKVVGPREVADEQARGFVKMASDVDIFHIKGQRWLMLMFATLTYGCGCPCH